MAADLHAAIRERLETYVDEGCGYSGHDCRVTGHDEMKAALRTVLDLHPADRDHMCIKDIVGYSVQTWYDDEPCPTVLAIAEKLGIET